MVGRTRRGMLVRSANVKRSIIINGHRTSISLEDPFWDGTKKIAAELGKTLAALVGEIDGDRQNCNLSSAVRTFVLNYFMEAAMVPCTDAHPLSSELPG